MPRIVRIGGSFAIMLVAYWAYALVAVPLIEPTVEPNHVRQLTEVERRSALHDANHRLESLRPLFRPEVDWELGTPWILESDQIKLLLQNYSNLGNGRVELDRCTLVYTPAEPVADPAERIRRSVVLQASDGALLEFDEELDLRRGKIGRLISGRLIGPVTIRSAGRELTPEDDLHITTKNVVISADRIRTNEPIRFRWGPNHGSGAQLQIDLLHEANPEASSKRAPKISGLKSLEIRRLDLLHLEFPQPKQAAETPGETAENLRIEVKCRGKFRFDAVQRLATFHDHVDVMQMHASGPSDQINCELLSIYFARQRNGLGRPSEEPQAASGETATLDLQPRRIEATGNPVVVRAPNQQFQARGDRLEYDAWSGRILLEGSQEVFLRQADNEIHARDVQYQPSDTSRIGQVIARGPGWLRGQADQRPGQQLTAQWSEQLHVRPVDRQQVISLSGGARLQFAGVGDLDGKEIHFWLSEVPSGADGKSTLRPDRMLARGQVQLASAQLSGNVEQLEVWFEEPTANAQSGLGPGGPPGLMTRIGSQMERAQLAMELARRFPAAQQYARRPALPAEGPLPLGAGDPNSALPQPASDGGAAGPSDPATGETPANHFEIVGRLLRAKVRVQAAESQLSELMVDGNVRFAQSATAGAAERPLVITGDQIHVLDAAEPHAAVTVTGNPAHFEGGGLGLTGSNINLNRGTNRLWIDGPGQMDVPLDRDLEGRPIQDAGPLTILWQTRMSFDGKTARFEEAVVAKTAMQQLQAETLDVTLKRSIRFADPRTQPKPELEQIVCLGGVQMESRTFDQYGLVSHDSMQIDDLAIQLISGEMTARGPGRLTSHRRNSGELLPGFAMPAGGGAADEADAAEKPLNYLEVRFQKNITGNVHHQSATFHQQVRATFGPVRSWEDKLNGDNPDALGPQAAVLSCDEMTVVRMPQPGGGSPAVELLASGNTLVEGAAFTARANRMTYAQAKDQLILEGDGWTDAQLYYQSVPGGPTSHFPAQKILFYPSTRRVDAAGAKALELNQLPRMDRKP